MCVSRADICSALIGRNVLADVVLGTPICAQVVRRAYACLAELCLTALLDMTANVVALLHVTALLDFAARDMAATCVFVLFPEPFGVVRAHVGVFVPWRLPPQAIAEG